MTDAQQREAARQFLYRWKDKVNSSVNIKEDEDARSFWIELLSDVFGMENVTQRVVFEKKVIGADGNTKRIDVYIPETHVLIEQKSQGIALNKPQPAHDNLTPYEQAKMYDNCLPFEEKARWIVTSNFTDFWIYDMNDRKPESQIVKMKLSELATKYHSLDFLVNREQKKITQEMKISLKAGEIVGELYDAFHKQYKNPDDPETLKSLNKLCVRLVFLLYGEDSGILGKKSMFHDYMEQYPTKDMRRALIELFTVLDQKSEERDEYLTDDLADFPYVNGGLFEDEKIEIPMFTDEIRDLLLNRASADFDWSGISPTIFGAVFESTLNPETRRSGGMHYTSLENIHKVIDPLFLDDLKAELREISEIGVRRTREKRLREYQDKLASLTFMDPAAGSGNFLTETYISIRRLENFAINRLKQGQMELGDAVNPIKVSISQFHGIEINDFAVTVAKTALWIAESQMMRETEEILSMELEFLPLKTNANIVEGNALRMDWDSVVPRDQLNYLYGNPPFRGYSEQSREQKEDIRSLYVDENGKLYKTAGKIDYVSGWYWKAAEMMQGTSIRTALVSTNSITQGEQVASVWKPLYDRFGIHIDFAYRTFRWDSEAAIKAHVHCVIIGFSCADNQKWRQLFNSESIQIADSISPYLIDAPILFLESRNKPLWDVPVMRSGGKPVEGGNLIFSQSEKVAFLEQEPKAEKYMRPFMGSDDFINGHPRWCLWLLEANPKDIKNMPKVMERVEAVRKFRLASVKPATRKFADEPTRFMEIKQPDSDYLMVPATSSENRRYIPIGYLDQNVVASNAASFVPSASLYHLGIMTSNVHMAWMRVVAGRLKSDYRYSVNIVYNNFPWPSPTDAQRAAIEATAQGILDARSLYPDSSLADLYDPLTMPPELRKAHAKNDAAVMKAYGMPIKETDEAACVAWLMRLYQEKASEA